MHSMPIRILLRVFRDIFDDRILANSAAVTFYTLLALFPAIAALVSLYGLFTLLLVFALRDGELSIIYPIIALNYVWVTFLSLIFFHETMNPLKACGVTVIVAGVMILGRGGSR